MRWLITTDGPNAHHYHRVSVATALKYCGHEVMISNLSQDSAYDIFDVYDPEIVWTQSYNLNEPLMECIERSKCKVFMRAFDFGDIGKRVASLNESGHNIMIEQASAQEKDNIKRLADRISFVCNHYVPSMFMEAMGGWADIVPAKPNMLGFCPFTYGGGQDMPEFRSDVTFIGSYHHRKPALNDYIVGLNTVKKGGDPLNVKVFSTWAWPSEYYCGVIPAGYNKHAYHNATICPNVSEDHSRLIGHDVIERIFAILGGGNFCLSDYVKGAAQLFPDEMVFASDKEDFHNLILHYLKNPHETQIYKDKGKAAVWKEHTYFHRAATIFDNLGLGEEARKVRNFIPKIKAETEQASTGQIV